MSGLLIVNADDFGGNRLATDRIARCFETGGLTSTSAMVYMCDSERAAQIARARNLPVGMHLNVTQAFEDPATPTAVRERQEHLVRYFARGRLRRFTFNPAVHACARLCIEDQLEEFRRLYGREPSHIDGHNHAHLSPSVFLALPKGMRARTRESSGREHLGLFLRQLWHELIARRQTTTDYFFAIDRLGGAPTVRDIELLLAPSSEASVEVMTHPDRDYDYRVLTSDVWIHALQQRRLGSFRQLSPGETPAAAEQHARAA